MITVNVSDLKIRRFQSFINLVLWGWKMVRLPGFLGSRKTGLVTLIPAKRVRCTFIPCSA